MTPHLNTPVIHSSGKRKTVCTSAVLAYFDIAPCQYRYAYKREQTEGVLRRHGWHVRSRRSQFPRKCTVGQLRAGLAKLNENCVYYVSVPHHAMLLDGQGNTIVDTAPRKRDRRRVVKVRAVYREA